jgi:beta-mannanase
MHHCAGNWYVWGKQGSNTKEDFKRAYIHVVNVFRSQQANVKFQLCYNCDKLPGDTGNFTYLNSPI